MARSTVIVAVWVCFLTAAAQCRAVDLVFSTDAWFDEVNEKHGAPAIYRGTAGVPSSVEMLYEGITGDLAADDQFLYWTTGNGIFRGPLTGGTPELLYERDDIPTEFESPGSQLEIVVHSEFLYWVHLDGVQINPEYGGLMSVRRATKDGGGTIETLFRNTSADSEIIVQGPLTIAANGDRLFFNAIGQLWSLPTDGSSPATRME